MKIIRQLLSLLKEKAAIKEFEVNKQYIGFELNQPEKEFHFLNLDQVGECDQQIIRNVRVSPTILDQQTFEPYYDVTVRVYPEMAQDIAVLGNGCRQDEYAIVGRQLSEAIGKARQIERGEVCVTE